MTANRLSCEDRNECDWQPCGRDGECHNIPNGGGHWCDCKLESFRCDNCSCDGPLFRTGSAPILSINSDALLIMAFCFVAYISKLFCFVIIIFFFFNSSSLFIQSLFNHRSAHTYSHLYITCSISFSFFIHCRLIDSDWLDSAFWIRFIYSFILICPSQFWFWSSSLTHEAVGHIKSLATMWTMMYARI